MKIFEPHLDLLKQALGNDVQDCHAELIKVALGWSRVYRVTLSKQGHSTRESVIVKTMDPKGTATALEAERELRFYQIMHPELCIPKPEVYFLTTDQASGFHVIVMEDLSPKHRFPAHPYQWTRAELQSVLHTYARLHTSSVNLHHLWLAPRHESLLDFDKISEQVAIVQDKGIWGKLQELPDLIAYARESCQKYADEKMVLLHGDTTPANAALPEDLHSELAALIDWQDVGIGMPEFDLAYLDLQPFDSARLVPRFNQLSLYWHFRAKLDPDIPSTEDQRARLLHADIVSALWLTAPAGRVALHPYRRGTYPNMHWASQYVIVYNRLRSLASEIR